MPQDEEIVWLPKELAAQVNELKDSKSIDKLIMKYIEDSKRNIQAQLDGLDDDVLRYRGLMIGVKQAFRGALEEQVTALDTLWDEYSKELPSALKRVEEVKKMVEPVKREIEDLTLLLGKIQTYDLKRLLEIINAIGYALASDSDTGKILKFLFDNYRRNEDASAQTPPDVSA